LIDVFAFNSDISGLMEEFAEKDNLRAAMQNYLDLLPKTVRSRSAALVKWLWTK
jgi:hypothetical protein